MGTDQLVEVISNLCLKLLPVLGVVLIIFLILLVKHVIDTVKTVNVTLTKTNDLVDECKGQIRKLDKPLNTISDLSDTVDEVHASAKNAVNTAINSIISNLEKVKEWIASRKGNDIVEIEKEESAVTSEADV